MLCHQHPAASDQTHQTLSSNSTRQYAAIVCNCHFRVTKCLSMLKSLKQGFPLRCFFCPGTSKKPIASRFAHKLANKSCGSDRSPAYSIGFFLRAQATNGYRMYQTVWNVSTRSMPEWKHLHDCNISIGLYQWTLRMMSSFFPYTFALAGTFVLLSLLRVVSFRFAALA